MSFGARQLGKQTPDFIRRIKAAYNYLSLALVAFIPSISHDFSISVDKLTLLIALAGVGINFIGEFFGVSAGEKSSVAAPNDQEVQNSK